MGQTVARASADGKQRARGKPLGFLLDSAADAGPRSDEHDLVNNQVSHIFALGAIDSDTKKEMTKREMLNLGKKVPDGCTVVHVMGDEWLTSAVKGTAHAFQKIGHLGGMDANAVMSMYPDVEREKKACASADVAFDMPVSSDMQEGYDLHPSALFAVSGSGWVLGCFDTRFDDLRGRYFKLNPGTIYTAPANTLGTHRFSLLANAHGQAQTAHVLLRCDMLPKPAALPATSTAPL